MILRLIVVALVLFTVACSREAAPPRTAAIGVGFANVTKETLDALKEEHAGAIKAEARAASAECASDACKRDAVDGTIVAAQPVTDKINAGVDLQRVIVSLVRAELECEESGNTDCSREKLGAILDKLPEIQNLVEQIRKEIKTWQKAKSKSSPSQPSPAPSVNRS